MGMAGGLLGGEQPQSCRRPDLLTEPNLQVCCWEGFSSNHTATAVSWLSVPPFTTLLFGEHLVTSHASWPTRETRSASASRRKRPFRSFGPSESEANRVSDGW